MRFVHRYASASTYNEERQNKYLEPWLSYTDETEEIHFNKAEDEKDDKLLEIPLTFEIIGDGVIRWACSSANAMKKTIQYRKNGGTWTNIEPNAFPYAPTIYVVSGDVI